MFKLARQSACFKTATSYYRKTIIPKNSQAQQLQQMLQSLKWIRIAIAHRWKISVRHGIRPKWRWGLPLWMMTLKSWLLRSTREISGRWAIKSNWGSWMTRLKRGRGSMRRLLVKTCINWILNFSRSKRYTLQRLIHKRWGKHTTRIL